MVVWVLERTPDPAERKYPIRIRESDSVTWLRLNLSVRGQRSEVMTVTDWRCLFFLFFFNCANLNLVLFVRSDVFTESLSDRNYIILWAIILLINQQPSWSVNQYICCCKIFNEWTILEETVECFIQCNDDNDDDDGGVSCQRMMKMMSWTLFNRK